MQKGFTIIAVVLGILVLGLVGGGAYYLGTQQKRELPSENINSSSEKKSPSPTPNSSPQNLLQEMTPQDEVLDAPIPTNKTIKSINFELPSGWKTVQNSTGGFEVGYDPNLFNAGPSEAFSGTVGFSKKDGSCCFHFYIDVREYDGGSRHNFIYKQSGVQQNPDSLKLPQTYEKNYLVNGKSSLVMYNIDGSSSRTTGMLIIDNKRAFSFSYSENDEAFVEKILATIKILK